MIRKQGLRRPIVYRPKPSWLAAVPIERTIYSRPPETLGSWLDNAYALVTHGSHAGIDSIVAGVPAIILGPGAARPVGNHAITDLGSLRFPSRRERFRWLSAIAWWQWRADEMAAGLTWKFLRDELERH